MPKYIDAEKLIRDLIDNRCFYPAIVKNAIENAPTEDVVEVVRCKDCHKRNTDDCWISFYNEDGELYCDTNNNDFCSHGERKE